MGWNLKKGDLKQQNVSEDEYWELFNFVFSDACRKTNTYKFGFIKSLVDNIFNAVPEIDGTWSLGYETIFAKFAENYWNLVVKYNIRQMRYNGQSELSALESIFQKAVTYNTVVKDVEFENIDETTREAIVHEVIIRCKRNVVGALYGDFEGRLFSFDISRETKLDGIFLSRSAYDFLVKYKMEIERINYYSWARYLEKVNDGNATVRLLEKLELATPKRRDLSVYREVLYREFEENTCFYCGKKLTDKIQVDHYIPWKFVKDDNLWNLVLTCPKCNLSKNSRLPAQNTIDLIIKRNKDAGSIHNDFVIEQFKNYDEGLIQRMWKYAKMSGYKEITHT